MDKVGQLGDAEWSFEISRCILKEGHTELSISHRRLYPVPHTALDTETFPLKLHWWAGLIMEPLSREQEHKTQWVWRRLHGLHFPDSLTGCLSGSVNKWPWWEDGRWVISSSLFWLPAQTRILWSRPPKLWPLILSSCHPGYKLPHSLRKLLQECAARINRCAFKLQRVSLCLT